MNVRKPPDTDICTVGRTSYDCLEWKPSQDGKAMLAHLSSKEGRKLVLTENDLRDALKGLYKGDKVR